MSKLVRTKIGVCRWCSTSFTPSSYPKGGGWYCSSRCKSEAKKPARLRRIDAENATLALRGTPVLAPTPEVRVLRALPYRQYLLTAHWSAKREEAFVFYGRTCVCGSRNFLNVHHRTYKNLGCEFVQELSVLCRDCHKETHGGCPPYVPPVITGRRKARKRKSSFGVRSGL